MYQSTGPTGAQAEATLLAKLNAMLPPSDDVISPDMAVSELAKFWWLEFGDLKLAADTRRHYREIVDTYILPGVGSLTIREANVSTLDKFLKGVRTNYGNATAKMSKTLLTGMLSLASRHGAAPANPLREVARIPTNTTEVRALTIDEVAELRRGAYVWQQPTGRQNGLHERDILDVVDIMLATGVRIGEALAIRWSDVNLDATMPTVTVRGTIIDVRGKNGLRIQDHPKSANSRQRYFLPPFAVEMLRRRQADPVRKNDLGLAFPSSTLTIRDPNGFRKQWRDARKAVGGSPWFVVKSGFVSLNEGGP